jgi:hypothetical protein
MWNSLSKTIFTYFRYEFEIKYEIYILNKFENINPKSPVNCIKIEASHGKINLVTSTLM